MIVRTYIFYCLIVTSLVCVLDEDIFAQESWGREYMSSTQVRKKWGDQKFNSARFKSATNEERAKMAYDLMRSKVYVNKTVETVFKELGPSTGLFFSEMIPAFVIGNINEKPNELWQLVFMLNKDSSIVVDVKVHKKCCY